ncbi:DUF2306 domain-containing protein [Pedobacter punctiformis]|uniref:DUF2306 domain-containing protein n=1 Tax=Pedobacter punctiformis TaxID=3004097 RepID=A0ABT4LD90_9SPHI|nr:DUF2306 domain-containing protein [Pedobacter sp. HCMS5-2]MCZ4245858.1 DUF2306 domain-containing protein [Pedobacter sp. HCMS5-2]
MNTVKFIVKNIGIYLLLCLATFLMLKGIVRYYPMEDTIGFLQFKQDYIHILPWKIAFYVHVFTIIFALLAGFTQFSNTILKKFRSLHRIIGKIYIIDILLVNFPAAFIMAVYANGLIPGKAAFIILDCLWFWFTLKALIEVKKGNIKGHKEYMIRSYALTLSAVTLRAWKIIFLSFATIDPLHLYMINAWLGFIPNLIFAEWLIRRKRRTLSLKADIG